MTSSTSRNANDRRAEDEKPDSTPRELWPIIARLVTYLGLTTLTSAVSTALSGKHELLTRQDHKYINTIHTYKYEVQSIHFAFRFSPAPKDNLRRHSCPFSAHFLLNRLFRRLSVHIAVVQWGRRLRSFSSTFGFRVFIYLSAFSANPNSSSSPPPPPPCLQTSPTAADSRALFRLVLTTAREIARSPRRPHRLRDGPIRPQVPPLPFSHSRPGKLNGVFSSRTSHASTRLFLLSRNDACRTRWAAIRCRRYSTSRKV